MSSTRRAINATHDPALRSWVDSANQAGCDFPIQNLPFGVFRRAGGHESFRVGVAIGDRILDLPATVGLKLLGDGFETPWAGPTLNALMAAGPAASSGLRARLSELLRLGAREAERLQPMLVPMAAAEFSLPAQIGDYTDFYTSIHHATTVGALFRPDNPLLPNYKWIPIAYHGRASSIGVSGQNIRRPCGQVLPAGASAPEVMPSRRLDYELELGVFVGSGNASGRAIEVGESEEHVFGMCLLNDWSARDVQAWEYQPLGPFLAKNFATTISPWVVTFEALAPYRVGWSRPGTDPQPLPYLDAPFLRERGAVDIELEVYLETALMRERGIQAVRISRSNYRHAYWTVAQMVAHHTVNGCNLVSGDLLGTGTQSGPRPEEGGSLLELTQGGKRALDMPTGETRTFLADGDRVTFRAVCESPTHVRIGFGQVSGTIVAS
ncbi:MAG TPA: fumarylacetoacetase [Steroidobacteraceae bacterium]|jgi:fumarylacetoacetase